MRKRINGISRLGDGHYMTQYVDVCRNCRGMGQVTTRESREDDVPVEICGVCEGSGRVVINKEIIVNVKPYNLKQ